MFFIFWVFLLSTTSFAGNNQLSSKKQDVPFDANEVIERVSHHQNEPRFSNFETGEFLIDTSFVYVPNPLCQMSPSIAFDGTNYLVVWDDDRNSDDFNIYGVRVNQAGFILDPGGIVISNAIHDQQFPSVTFDGSNYLVVWHDDRDYEFCDIYGARVNQAGVVLDPDGFVVSTGIYDDMFPCITSDGNNLFVVWQDMRNDNCDIYGARITQTGILIDSSGIAISVAADSQAFPAISFDGTNYFVVWQDCRNGFSVIYGARINSFGIVLDTGGIILAGTPYLQRNPSVAFDGINYLVVWDDYRYRTRGIYGTRVTQAGIVLDTNGICISLAGMDRICPSVNFDGTNYFVVWQDYRNHNWDIYGARVNQGGIVLDPEGIAIDTVTNEQRYSSLAFDGTNYLVVWEDFRSGFNWDIYGTRVSQMGSVIDMNGFILSAEVNFQYSPVGAFDGTNYLVAWEDRRNGLDSDVYGARVNPTGIILDSISIAISTAADWQGNPSVAFDGTNYLVVWDDWRSGDHLDIYGARINQTGLILDPEGIIISAALNTQGYPSVTFDGINYFVVWVDYRSGDTSDIYGTRINQAGIVLDPDGIAISTATNYQWNPSLIFDGINYFVVWDDRRNDYGDLYGARVNQAGVVIDTNGIIISATTGSQRSPAISFDGTNYFVVWQDIRSGDFDIYGARVNLGGIVLDTNGIVISNAPGEQMIPSVTFDGTDYLVVWEDWINYDEWNIIGAKVNTSGIVVDTFPVSTQTGDQFVPTLARGAGNQVLIIYSGWADFINTHPVKTYRIWGKFYPFVGIEEENSKLKMQSTKLLEIQPNPFKNITQIKYNVKSRGDAEIKIYDITGKIVKSFSSNNQQLITNNCLVWDGNDNSGKVLPAGVYFCTLKVSKGTAETKQIIILK